MNSGTGAVVADTQVLIWYVLEPSRLSDVARQALEAAVEGQDPIRVGAWSIVDIVYAAEKVSNPITDDDCDAILGVLSDAQSPFEVKPWTRPSPPGFATYRGRGAPIRETAL